MYALGRSVAIAYESGCVLHVYFINMPDWDKSQTACYIFMSSHMLFCCNI